MIHSAFHISVWIINRLCQSCCFTCASCLDAAWPAGRKDEQNSDSSRCSEAESHTHRKVIPALQQQLRPGKVLIVLGINQCSLFLERPRRLQEYKHSTELGQTVSSQAERRSLKKDGGPGESLFMQQQLINVLPTLPNTEIWGCLGTFTPTRCPDMRANKVWSCNTRKWRKHQMSQGYFFFFSSFLSCCSLTKKKGDISCKGQFYSHCCSSKINFRLGTGRHLMIASRSRL